MNRLTLTVIAFAFCIAPSLSAQDTDKPEAKEPPQRSAEEVAQELERLRRERPTRPEPQSTPKPEATETQRSPTTIDPPARPIAPSQSNVAPDARGGAGGVYREGDTLLARRARMVHSESSPTGWMLTFDSDSSGLHDPPLRLVHCRALEDMEAAIARNGESAEFLVTGEILVYRNEAYFLPRITRPAVNRGNLRQ